MVACRIGLVTGPFAGDPWLRLVAAGFEAATVGALADWFAVTALFRHPLGLPIPHTAIIPTRRAKIVESIANIVENDWLSPDVIGARLARFAPSEPLLDWLRTPGHVERLGAPVRDLLRGLARVLTEPEVADFADRALRRQLRELPLDASAGTWVARALESGSAAAAFETAATSLARLAALGSTWDRLDQLLLDLATKRRDEGKTIEAFLLRRKSVRKRLVLGACQAAGDPLSAAARDRDHPLRRAALDAVAGGAEGRAGGDAAAREMAERLRGAIVESLEAGPLVRDTLARLRSELEAQLDAQQSSLSTLIDRRLRSGIADLLDDPERRATFDRWVRATADELLRRHHHQIGLTVRENLEALDTGMLVSMIEARVGNDLQFIRLNGAVVGGPSAWRWPHWLSGERSVVRQLSVPARQSENAGPARLAASAGLRERRLSWVRAVCAGCRAHRRRPPRVGHAAAEAQAPPPRVSPSQLHAIDRGGRQPLGSVTKTTGGAWRLPERSLPRRGATRRFSGRAGAARQVEHAALGSSATGAPALRDQPPQRRRLGRIAARKPSPPARKPSPAARISSASRLAATTRLAASRRSTPVGNQSSTSTASSRAPLRP